MTDITKCKGTGCPVHNRERCRRFKSTANDIHQSWMETPGKWEQVPFTVHSLTADTEPVIAWKCDHFIRINGKPDYQNK